MGKQATQRVRFGRAARSGAPQAAVLRGLLALALCAAGLGCGKATHTVGHVGAGAELDRGRGADDGDEPPSDPAERPATAGTDAGSSNGASGGTGGGEPSHSPPPSAADAAVRNGCEPNPMPAARKRLDLYLMVDTNITLPWIGAWNYVLNGISAYVDQEAAAGTGLGIDYFGLDCEVRTYSTPTVGVGVLPENARAIQISAARVIPINISPMLPALEGALTYARSRANAYPDTKQAVVLVTDGFADLMCGSDARSLAEAAARGAEGAPAVPTYVIALDVPELADLFNRIERFDPLDLIARAGRTGQARRIDVQDPLSVFVSSLLDVQSDAEPCDYALPERVLGDPNAIKLGLSEMGSSPAPLERVEHLDECGEGYYPSGDGAFVSLCPSACASVKQNRASLIWYTDCAQ